MIGFGIDADVNNQKNLWLGFVIAIAIHIIFGFYITSILKVDSVIENERSLKQFNVELRKLEDKIEKTINKPLSEDINDADSLSNEITEPKTPQPEPTILFQPSIAWIETEIRNHLKENPDSIEKFKQSFVINQNNNSEPASYLRESKDGIISVNKKMFGRNVCYSFDAKDGSFGTINFELLEPCKEKSNFNFMMRRLK